MTSQNETQPKAGKQVDDTAEKKEKTVNNGFSVTVPIIIILIVLIFGILWWNHRRSQRAGIKF